jgi:Domain of Unknown Function (DUF748)
MSKKLKIILGIVAVLVIIRLFLPAIVLKLVNRELASMDGYYGKVRDIDIALLRGAYVIDSLFINKLDTINDTQTPFIAARIIDLSIEWRSLFKGRVVGELEFTDPVMVFTRDKTELSDVRKDTSDFRHLLKSLMPLKINRFEIKNGKLAYKDGTTDPKVDISLDSAYIVASNLSNVQDTSVLPSRVNARAKVYQGDLNMELKLDALSKVPLFDLNVKLENTHLPELNDFFKAYARIDVSDGEFNMYSEIAAKDGKFTGYVKPIIKDLDVLGPQDRGDNIMQKAWEGLVGFVGMVVENQSKDQIATKIPVNGEFGDANVGVFTAVAELLRNAFIQALYPSLEHQITLADVDKDEKKEGFLKRLFGKDEKKDKNKK